MQKHVLVSWENLQVAYNLDFAGIVERDRTVIKQMGDPPLHIKDIMVFDNMSYLTWRSRD